jgi:hypothetical protein
MQISRSLGTEVATLVPAPIEHSHDSADTCRARVAKPPHCRSTSGPYAAEVAARQSVRDIHPEHAGIAVCDQSALGLVVNALILWTTRYMDAALNHLSRTTRAIRHQLRRMSTSPFRQPTLKETRAWIRICKNRKRGSGTQAIYLAEKLDSPRFLEAYRGRGSEYFVPIWPNTPAGKHWSEVTQKEGGRDVKTGRHNRESIFAWEAKVYRLVAGDDF